MCAIDATQSDATQKDTTASSLNKWQGIWDSAILQY